LLQRYSAAAMTIIPWLNRLTSRVKVLETALPVLNSATSTSITAAQAKRGITVSNLGATGTVEFNLPAAEVGMLVRAVVRETQVLQLDPVDTTGKIYSTAAVLGGAGKNISADAKGETVTLVCIEANHWTPVAFTGTWSVEA